MLNALAKSVMDFLHQSYQIRANNEGEPKDGWVLIDAGDIIVHIFSNEKRNYYKLEDLWSQGKILLRVQ
jgi:ribosome-associated protein